MVRLEDLTTGTHVKGIIPDATAELVSVKWHGSDVLEVVYKDGAGRTGTEMLFRDREPSLVEPSLGCEPADVSAENRGYGVESRIPNGGEPRLVGIKGRLVGAEGVTIARNDSIQ